MGINSLYYRSAYNTVSIIIIIIVNRQKDYTAITNRAVTQLLLTHKNFEKHTATATDLHTRGGDGDRKIKHRSRKTDQSLTSLDVCVCVCVCVRPTL